MDVSVKFIVLFILNDVKYFVDFDVVVKVVELFGLVIVEIIVILLVDILMMDVIIIVGNFGSDFNMLEWDLISMLGVVNCIDVIIVFIMIIYENLIDLLIIEYKWIRGFWVMVEKDINGEEIFDRVEVIISDYVNIMIENIVECWVDMNLDLMD